ncbi:hypothetical protein [Helicobacter pylori]|uniref:hypothetical protein n=1 Tax=Helicobacter pylori TaxID=210 RepID=UPI00292939CB|nr:hypothetical protein [Helicobacter pylori]MDU9701836.1 hypothetical protein [Helicobacter pylori]
MGSFFSLGKSSNDTQENSKDAQGREKALKAQEENTKLKEANTELNRERNDLITEKDNLTNQLNASQKQVKELEQSQQVLKNEKAELSKEKENLTKEKTDLTEKNKDLSTEKDNLAKANTELIEKNKALITEKDNLNTDLSNAKSQANQTSQKLNDLEQKHAPYKKLEKLYEVFFEVKGCLNFNFVATTHSAMDLIASVLSDSKYYLESLYNKTSQELSDKKSDKGEKLAELFDLLFEYIKDKKFERLKEPSTYDSTCKSLYPEQNTSQKMQRVVLKGYTYDKKIACYTVVDMGG